MEPHEIRPSSAIEIEQIVFLFMRDELDHFDLTPSNGGTVFIALTSAMSPGKRLILVDLDSRYWLLTFENRHIPDVKDFFLNYKIEEILFCAWDVDHSDLPLSERLLAAA